MARFSGMILGLFMSTTLVGQSIDGAPPMFLMDDNQVIAVDFQSSEMVIDVDVWARTAIARAKVSFAVVEAGYPMFDLVPGVISASVNDEELSLEDIAETPGPDGQTSFRVLRRRLEAGSMGTLEVVYDLSSKFTFGLNFARAGFFMNDLQQGGRGLWEAYAPSSFEFDQFAQTIRVNIYNARRYHQVYANGNVVADALGFTITYPEYYTASSFYFHLTEAGRFYERRAILRGMEADIPVTVYANSPFLANRALERTIQAIAVNEATYGAYAHPGVLVYANRGGASMEYAGATVAAIDAIEHEVTHFWFGRGVMPADGNAGWIDEAVASWRDAGYPRALAAPSGVGQNLGGFSAYRREATMDAFTLGAQFISQLDYMFQDVEFEGQTGMRAILRQLYAERKRTALTLPAFKAFLENATETDLTDIFATHVYGEDPE